MSQQHEFLNIYSHNFIRTAVVLPKLKVADPEYNSRETIDLLRQAMENKAILAVSELLFAGPVRIFPSTNTR
jgi:NAD+ synthase (glutamine-hydrolysing)